MMPGKPVPEVGWPGTKNGESHRVWLPQAAVDLLAETGDETDGDSTAGKLGEAQGHAAYVAGGFVRDLLLDLRLRSCDDACGFGFGLPLQHIGALCVSEPGAVLEHAHHVRSLAHAQQARYADAASVIC